MVNEVKSGQTMISSSQREDCTKLLAFMGDALAILIWCGFSWYGLGLTKAPFTHQEMRAITTILEQMEEQVIISMFHGHMANSEMLITWQCGSMCSCLLPTNITLTWSWSLRVLILVSVGLHTWNALTLTNLHHNKLPCQPSHSPWLHAEVWNIGNRFDSYSQMMCCSGRRSTGWMSSHTKCILQDDKAGCFFPTCWQACGNQGKEKESRVGLLVTLVWFS
jgi:hypothetical protein